MNELSRKRVLLVGAGGLGSPVALILARAGVGCIEVVDDDTVDASNLHRQLLFSESDVGRSKVTAARTRIENEAKVWNSLTRTVAREMRVAPDLAPESLRNFDLVVEGADNFATKFLIADACAIAKVPCVQAGAVRWTGWVLGTVPNESACLRCVFEDIPPGPAHTCAVAGVVGPVVGVVGALQAGVALRLLLGDRSAAGVLHSYRALPGALRESHVSPRVGCSLCEGRIRDLDPARYTVPDCAA